MEDKKIENDILLKTAMMGFDKKGVMDFVEKLQLENEELKRRVVALTAENEELRDAVEKLQTLHDSYNDEDQPFVTYEDLAMDSFGFEDDTVKRADLAERTIAAYTVIQEQHPDAELVDASAEPTESAEINDGANGDIAGYAGEYSEYDTYPMPASDADESVAESDEPEAEFDAVADADVSDDTAVEEPIFDIDNTDEPVAETEAKCEKASAPVLKAKVKVSKVRVTRK